MYEKNIKYDFNIFYSADAVVWLRTEDIRYGQHV